MDRPLRRLMHACLLLACIPCFWSCGNVRQLQYLQGQFDTAALSRVNYPKPVIQRNDLLNITVYSDNPVASAYYNLPAQPNLTTTGTMVQGSAPALNAGSSYLVDDSGNIQFPGLGTLAVAGLNKDQLYQLLKTRLADKLQNAYFIIRLANYRVTMIGEVAKPGEFTIPNERVSLLEAIGLAGDLTPYGRRDNILVIREINGERTFQRLNLKDPGVLASPYFYLQPNDVVIVDLNRNKAAANDQVTVRNISLATSIISVLAILVGVLR
jgi:polysaccharide biosynthesis/export protein